MTNLITGATGFVGSQLVDDLLLRNEGVRALIRDRDKADGLRQRGVQVVVGDVRSPDVFRALLENVEVVYHCAAAVGPQFSKREIYETNLTGVRYLLEALGSAQLGRLVLLSSVNVLGTRDLDPATEDLPCRRSRDPAADVKIEAERLALDYHRRGVDVTVIRPGFIYGPRDPHNLPKLVRAVQRGKFAFLGSRDNVVPIVHVSDVAQAMLLAGRTPAASGRVYQITDGSRTTVGELVDELARQLGCAAPRKVLPYFVPWLGCQVFDVLRLFTSKPAPINRAGLRFLGTSRYVDISRARRELGYEPRVFYREGIAAAVRCIKEQHQGEGSWSNSSRRPNCASASLEPSEGIG